MSKNTVKDHRTKAIVLRRTNYGEADRILTLLTKEGLISAMAKGVRREKSKLAGGIELLSLSEITYHEGKSGGLATLTSAKMLKFYQNLTLDLAKMELAALVMKKVARAAEDIESPDYFDLVQDVLEHLNEDTRPSLIETYFWLNFTKIGGEAVNLHYDTTGAKLSPDQAYLWDDTASALAPVENGPIAANDIKFLRLMLSSPLQVISRVQYPSEKLSDLLYLAKSAASL